MRIAIVANSQGEAQDLITFYGLRRDKDDVRVFTSREMLMGMDFAGWLVITANTSDLVPNTAHHGRDKRYWIMGYLG